MARLSTNWLVAKLAGVYVEVMQDIPVLLQLFFWYAIFYEGLPPPREALNPGAGIYLSNRGVAFTVPEAHPGHLYMLIVFVIGCVIAYGIRRWARRRQETTGRLFPTFRVGVAVVLGLPFITWLAFGAPMKMNAPQLTGFNFEGGMVLSPEFIALLTGLVLYTAAYVSEVVRAGIQSVSKGQREAAMSIGLKPIFVLNLVILPRPSG